ncbi:hypothetical protein Tco_0014997 [Tanacetum coccineum]
MDMRRQIDMLTMRAEGVPELKENEETNKTRKKLKKECVQWKHLLLPACGRGRAKIMHSLALPLQLPSSNLEEANDSNCSKSFKADTTSTQMETQNPLLKDEDGEEVDVHMYRYQCQYKVSPSFYAVKRFLRLISWQCKKQTVVANSTTEAEYVAASSCCGQVKVNAVEVEYNVSTSIGYGVSSFLSNTTYSSQQTNTAYLFSLDTVYRSSGTEANPKFSVIDFHRPDFQFTFVTKINSEEGKDEAMAETMEQYMSKTRTDYGSGVARPKIDNKDQFELKGQFLKELQENTFSGSDNEDANEHIEKVLEIVDLFHVLNITVDQLMLQSFRNP